MQLTNSRVAHIFNESIFSDDGNHRYLLTRVWNNELPSVTIIMLNPSYADELMWDWSSMRIMNYIVGCKKYGGIDIVNLFSCIEKDSERLTQYKQKFDDNTDKYINKVIEKNSDIIIAWGVNKNRKTRIKTIKKFIKKYNNKNIFRLVDEDDEIKHISVVSNHFKIIRIDIDDIIKD